jgi:hypothetical protein
MEIGGMRTRTATALLATIAIILWLAAQTAHGQMIGEVGVLKGAAGAGSVPVFPDRRAIDAFYEANIRNDKEGTEELFNAGRLLMVDVGTKVRVLDGGGFTGPAEVRILEGEFSGRRVFLSRQWIAPTGSNTGQSRKSVDTSSDTSVPRDYDMNEEKRKLEKLQEEYRQLTKKHDKKEAHKAAKETNESLGVTPTPTPKPKHKRDSSKHQTGPAGEPIYPSRPVSPGNSGKGSSSDWGTTWVLRNGRYEQVPVYYGVYRRKEQMGLEQEQRGEDNITPEQRELWRRMDRPFGTQWRSFSSEDSGGYPNN